MAVYIRFKTALGVQGSNSWVVSESQYLIAVIGSDKWEVQATVKTPSAL